MAKFELDEDLIALPKNSLLQRLRDRWQLRASVISEMDGKTQRERVVAALDRDCSRLFDAVEKCG